MRTFAAFLIISSLTSSLCYSQTLNIKASGERFKKSDDHVMVWFIESASKDAKINALANIENIETINNSNWDELQNSKAQKPGKWISSN